MRGRPPETDGSDAVVMAKDTVDGARLSAEKLSSPGGIYS